MANDLRLDATPPALPVPHSRAAGSRDRPSRRLNQVTRAAVLLWGAGRLPVLALVAYLLRNPILNVIERQFDVLAVTRFVIGVLSTPVARLLWAASFFCLLLLAAVSVSRLRPTVAYVTLLGAAGALISLSSAAGVTSLRRALFVALILAVNLAPGRFLELLKRFPPAWNTLMFAGVGVTELFFAREYWRWLRGRIRGVTGPDHRTMSAAAAIPGLLLTSVAFAILVRGDQLLPFEQGIRMSADVRVLERGLSFNWIELDPAGAHLYVTGHSLDRLRRYDVRDLTAPPLLSSASTGGAQGFAYDPNANELHAFNTSTRRLLSFDATTLELTRVFEVPDLSPGDPWVAVDPGTDTLTMVSEADLQTGVPLVVLDRATGRVLAQADLDAGNVLKHPAKPRLYLTFFRRRSEVVLYDLETRSLIGRAPADARAERMVFWRKQNELLVTSPLESRVMRFDADRLESKGFIAALFGVRAIAIDEARNLLLCGNIATGHVIVIDLESGRRLRSYYLGPWLRTIELQVESGTAFVSSNGALYLLHYAPPLTGAAVATHKPGSIRP